MSNSKKSPVHVALTELGWPILYGFSATVAFYFLAFRGPFNFPLVHRYFASHPVSIVTTTMFFVGGAALLLKLIDVLRNASAIDPRHSVRVTLIQRGIPIHAVDSVRPNPYQQA